MKKIKDVSRNFKTIKKSIRMQTNTVHTKNKIANQNLLLYYLFCASRQGHQFECLATCVSIENQDRS